MRKHFFILFVINALAFASSLAASTVRCEIRNNICNLQDRVDSNDITIAARRSELINVIFIRSRNTKFLPILLHLTFPNLEGINFQSGSIRNISRNNFDKLNRLTDLILTHHKIETIRSDTFQDLLRLKMLILSKWFHYSIHWSKFKKTIFLHSQEEIL